LDLFCCEGGAAVGYHRAGFDVVGVDREARFARRYPFELHQGDALTFVREHGREFDVIHASPPCQRYSHGTVAGHAHKHPDLLGPTRAALVLTGRPYVIENVPRAPLHSPLVLCGSMFDLATEDDDGTPLRLERHRLFESSLLLAAPRPCNHDRTVRVAGSYGGARRDKDDARLIRKGGYVPSVAVQQRLLGIDWMTQHGMYQSVPPAYTEFLGHQLMAHLREAAA
jgi:DNA (cytosine-5)-methyltransferase 1